MSTDNPPTVTLTIADLTSLIDARVVAAAATGSGSGASDVIVNPTESREGTPSDREETTIRSPVASPSPTTASTGWRKILTARRPPGIGPTNFPAAAAAAAASTTKPKPTEQMRAPPPQPQPDADALRVEEAQAMLSPAGKKRRTGYGAGGPPPPVETPKKPVAVAVDSPAQAPAAATGTNYITSRYTYETSSQRMRTDRIALQQEKHQKLLSAQKIHSGRDKLAMTSEKVQQSVSELESHISGLKRKRSEMEQEMQYLDHAIVKSENDAEAKRQELDAIQAQDLELMHDLIGVKRDLTRIGIQENRDWQPFANNLKNQVNTLTGERDNLKNQVNTLNGEKDGLNKQVNELTTERDDLKGKMEESQKSVADLTKAKEDLSKELAELKKKLEETKPAGEAPKTE